MFLIVAFFIGFICALIAHSTGRSEIGWFFIGILLGLIGLIICIVMPNLKEQQEKEEQMKMEQRRLEEQLRQERIKNERFQTYAYKRLDIHDSTLKIDTRQPFPEDAAETAKMIEGDQFRAIEDTPHENSASDTNGRADTGSSEYHQGWYFHEQGQNYGPLTIHQVRQHIADGKIQHTTQLWHSTLKDWKQAGQVGLFDFGEAV